MFFQLDGTVVIQLINFVIFFALLNVVFLRPVGAAIKRRRDYINGVERDYEGYAKEAATLRADAHARRAAARRTAEETVTQARARAEAKAQEIAAREAARAQTIIDEARRVVEGEVAAARSRENELSQQLATTLLTRALGSAQ